MKRKCNNCIEIIRWKQDGIDKFKCRAGRLGDGSWNGNRNFSGCLQHRHRYEDPAPDADVVYMLRNVERELKELIVKVDSYNRVMRKLSKQMEAADD